MLVFSNMVWFSHRNPADEDWYIGRYDKDKERWELNDGFGWYVPPGDTWSPPTTEVFEGTWEECVAYIEKHRKERDERHR